MKLFTLKVPELAHLEVAERESVLKGCLQSTRFKKFQRFAPGTMVAILLGSVLVMALGDWEPAYCGIVFIGLFLGLRGLKVACEAWLLRAEARKSAARLK